jgi:hypothetical protein
MSDSKDPGSCEWDGEGRRRVQANTENKRPAIRYRPVRVGSDRGFAAKWDITESFARGVPSTLSREIFARFLDMSSNDGERGKIKTTVATVVLSIPCR